MRLDECVQFWWVRDLALLVYDPLPRGANTCTASQPSKRAWLSMCKKPAEPFDLTFESATRAATRKEFVEKTACLELNMQPNCAQNAH